MTPFLMDTGRGLLVAFVVVGFLDSWEGFMLLGQLVSVEFVGRGNLFIDLGMLFLEVERLAVCVLFLLLLISLLICSYL